jgi:hypothetical protein
VKEEREEEVQSPEWLIPSSHHTETNLHMKLECRDLRNQSLQKEREGERGRERGRERERERETGRERERERERGGRERDRERERGKRCTRMK